MINVDLEYLEFLMHPSHNKYLQDRVSVIKEAYIEEYGEEARELINYNFDNVNYVFLEEVDAVLEFIKNFSGLLIKDVYNKVSNLFSLEEWLTLNEAIYSRKEKFNLGQDDDLQVLRILIRPYLVDQIENTSTEQEKVLLSEKLALIDKWLSKYDEIRQIFKEKLVEIEKNRKEQEEYRITLQKRFLLDRICCFSEEDKKDFIISNYDFSKLIEKYPELELYVNNYEKTVFELGDLAVFYETLESDFFDSKTVKSLLRKYGVDTEKEQFSIDDIDECLRILKVRYKDYNSGIIYYGEEALVKLVEGLEEYNRVYKEYFKSKKYLLSKNEFVNNHLKVDESASNLLKKKAEILDELSIVGFVSMFRRLFDLILYHAEFPGTAAFAISYRVKQDDVDMVFSYVVLKIYDALKFDYDKEEFVECFFENLIHELGHVAVTSLEKCFSGFHTHSDYKVLNELFTEWLTVKIWHRLKNLDLFNNCFNNEIKSAYRESFILIESFVEKFENYFKEASLNHDVSVFENLMTPDLFREYIDLVNVAYEDEIYDWFLDASIDDPYVIKLKEDLEKIWSQIKKVGKSRIKRRIDG